MNALTPQLTYLAAPYSSPDVVTQEIRFELVSKAAARLIREGKFIYSPISHTHPIAMYGELPKGWEFWKQYDEVMLSYCKEITVLMLVGWQSSIGVQAEIQIAVKQGIPITYLEEDFAW